MLNQKYNVKLWPTNNEHVYAIFGPFQAVTIINRIVLYIFENFERSLPILRRVEFYFQDQWGRRPEIWPNTEARLTGWMRVNRQVWFGTWWTGRTARYFVLYWWLWQKPLSCELMKFQLLLYSKCTQTSVMRMAGTLVDPGGYKEMSSIFADQ